MKRDGLLWRIKPWGPERKEHFHKFNWSLNYFGILSRPPTWHWTPGKSNISSLLISLRDKFLWTTWWELKKSSSPSWILSDSSSLVWNGKVRPHFYPGLSCFHLIINWFLFWSSNIYISRCSQISSRLHHLYDGHLLLRALYGSYRFTSFLPETLSHYKVSTLYT